MNRIEGVEPGQKGFFTGIFLRLVYWIARRKLGKVPTPTRVLGHHPSLLMATGRMELAQEKLRLVDAALKSLVQLRTGSLVGCPF